MAADVVVVGGGGAGLIAALSAAELGAEVLVLEASSESTGNTARSTGMIPAAGTRWQREAGIEDSPELMRSDIEGKNGGDCNRDLLRALCSRSAEAVEWLNRHCPLELELGFLYPGMSVARMHRPTAGYGGGLMARLREAAQTAVDIHFNAQVTERPGAPAVILAADGFGANRAWLKRYAPEISGAPFFGHPANLGGGIEIARAEGAELAYMDAYQGHAAVADDGAPFAWVAFVNGAVLVDRSGARVTDERKGYSACTADVVRQPGMEAWAIIDRELLDQTGLAKLERLDGSGLLLGTDHLGSRLAETLRESGREWSEPIYSVHVRAGLFHTQGGARVDTEGRALRPDGRPVPGLYCAGGTAEGISGRGAGGYLAGNGLLSAVVLGRQAGLAAARDVLKK